MSRAMTTSHDKVVANMWACLPAVLGLVPKNVIHVISSDSSIIIIVVEIPKFFGQNFFYSSGKHHFQVLGFCKMFYLIAIDSKQGAIELVPLYVSTIQTAVNLFNQSLSDNRGAVMVESSRNFRSFLAIVLLKILAKLCSYALPFPNRCSSLRY